MLCGPTNPTTCNLCVSANQTLPPVFEKPKTRLAQIRGYQVRRAEKGTQVQYWRFDEERKINDSNGEPRTEKVRLERPQVFIAYVFNAEQIDGVPRRRLVNVPGTRLKRLSSLCKEQILNLSTLPLIVLFTDHLRIPSICL